MRRDFDGIWIAAAERLCVPVVRGERADDPYVHWDGQKLHIAADEHLDDDDTVAQLVLHELCHSLVQGPEAMWLADWGLDNTTDRDEVRERAAVRLQAHLLGAYGLRGVLYPTTVVRAFFEGLGDDALFPAEDESSRLARSAAVRAAQVPMRDVLQEALEATAVAAGFARHRKSGFPLAGGEKTCGSCAARSATGLCRQADKRVFVRESDAACTRFEGPLDCLACGACCRSAYDLVPVRARDRVVKKHPDLVLRRDDKYLQLRRTGDRCAALAGPAGGPFSCTIYEDRPRTCSDFEQGGRHCMDARRRVGLSF